jgi:uncharacterized protein YggE
MIKVLATAPLWLALLAAPAAAQETARPVTPQIVTQGTGEVRVAPDRAIVRFGVQIDAADAKTAQGRVNEAMQRVNEALRRLTIPENRIGTERLELSPVYEPQRPQDTRPRLSGYRAANVVRVELDDLARLGPIIDAAVGAGANNIEGIEFTLTNEAPHRMEALRQASREARAKAEAITQALGVHLGSLIEATEGGIEVVPPRPLAFERSVMAATPVQPGELTVRATVTVRYRWDP